MMMLPTWMKLQIPFYRLPQHPVQKQQRLGAFMTVMVNDCYEEKDQKIFHEGMNKLNDFSKKNL